MALLTITCTVEGGDEALRRVSALTSADRTAAHQVMSVGVEALTQGHLSGLGRGRMGTSSRLGAQPTEFYSKAASQVEAKGDATGVRITMPRAGLSRAFRDYHLRPLSGKLLTIPVDPEAYGKRARQISGLKWRRFSDEDVAEGLSTHAGLVLGRPAAEPGGLFHALLRGATKVHQKQDRAILPSDEAWLDELAEGALTYLEEGGTP